MEEYYCRVCGFNNYPEVFWGNTIPFYIICPCCGCESGNDDYTIESTKNYRVKWINEGANWFEPSEKPVSWNLTEQIKNVPRGFK
jgi:hypothetical protein